MPFAQSIQVFIYLSKYFRWKLISRLNFVVAEVQFMVPVIVRVIWMCPRTTVPVKCVLRIYRKIFLGNGHSKYFLTSRRVPHQIKWPVDRKQYFIVRLSIIPGSKKIMKRKKNQKKKKQKKKNKKNKKKKTKTMNKKKKKKKKQQKQ